MGSNNPLGSAGGFRAACFFDLKHCCKRAAVQTGPSQDSVQPFLVSFVTFAFKPFQVIKVYPERDGFLCGIPVPQMPCRKVLDFWYICKINIFSKLFNFISCNIACTSFHIFFPPLL